MTKVLCLFLFSNFLFSGDQAFSQSSDCVNKLSWLRGTWSEQKSGVILIEQWRSTPAALEGNSYEVKALDTTLTETITISCVAGKTVFTFHPVRKGEQDVNFVLVSSDNNVFVFENKSHDFPQRIVYSKINSQACNAWIEGIENGKHKRIDFQYTKAQ
jgi:hypothetical protein